LTDCRAQSGLSAGWVYGYNLYRKRENLMNASRAAWGLAAVLTVGLALFANSHGWREDSRASAGSHSVTLHWLPATFANSYNVYRGTVSGGPYVNIGTTATTTYVDNALPGSGVFIMW